MESDILKKITEKHIPNVISFYMLYEELIFLITEFKNKDIRALQWIINNRTHRVIR